MSDTKDAPEEQKPIIVTEELAAQYTGGQKGRIPKAIAKQVVAINHAKKKEKLQEKRAALEKKKDGTIKQTPKMDLFLEEFMKNGGNATRAALAVFNVSSLESAAAIGHNYLKKAKALGRMYLEKRGYGYGRLLDIAAKKAEDSKTPEWWDRLMKIAEYEDFLTKDKPVTGVVNIFQAQKDMASQYVEGEVEDISPVEEETDEDKLP